MTGELMQDDYYNWIIKSGDIVYQLHRDSEQKAAILRLENSYGIRHEFSIMVDFEIKLDHDYPISSDMFQYAIIK